MEKEQIVHHSFCNPAIVVINKAQSPDLHKPQILPPFAAISHLNLKHLLQTNSYPTFPDHVYLLDSVFCPCRYNILRKSASLLLSLFHLMAGAAIPDVRDDPEKAMLKLQVQH